MFDVILAGRRVRNLKEKCFTAAILQQVKDIPSLIQFCSAEEASKLQGHGTTSDSQNASSYGKDSTRNQSTTDGPPLVSTGIGAPPVQAAGAAA